MGDPEVILEQRLGAFRAAPRPPPPPLPPRRAPPRAVPPPGAAASPRLFSPLALGRLRLPNRFSVPGLTTNYATPDGFVTDALCDYLAARARGGFGLIVPETLGVHPGGRVMPRMAMIDDDRYVPGLARLAAAVKREGGVGVGQLSHAGRQTKRRITGRPLVAPSAIPCPINRETPRALAADEILELEAAFVSAAVRLAAAGFDGVEIHGADGYLVGAFLSRYAIRRDDAFGGPLANRLRFLLDIVDGIQRALGRDFPLIVRLSAREFVPDGLDLPEAIEIARRLRDRGVHALSVSVGVYESFNTLSMVSGEPEGRWLPLAAAIGAAAAVPALGVGRGKRAPVAEAALASGQMALAAFGRASIADPDLPRKVRDGEATSAAAPAGPPVRLAIRCASVSALTAAWVAARRGHTVTVHEPSPVLGGLQALRARVPGQEEVGETLEALVARATAAGVRLIRGEPEPGAHDVLWAVRGPAAARGRTVTSYDV